MPSFMEEKKHIKNAILLALKRDKVANFDTLLASLCLETGFKEATIRKIFEQLCTVGAIKVEKNRVILVGTLTEITQNQADSGGD